MTNNPFKISRDFLSMFPPMPSDSEIQKINDSDAGGLTAMTQCLSCGVIDHSFRMGCSNRCRDPKLKYFFMDKSGSYIEHGKDFLFIGDKPKTKQSPMREIFNKRLRDSIGDERFIVSKADLINAQFPGTTSCTSVPTMQHTMKTPYEYIQCIEKNIQHAHAHYIIGWYVNAIAHFGCFTHAEAKQQGFRLFMLDDKEVLVNVNDYPPVIYAERKHYEN